MFLRGLTNNVHKALFLECACLIVMAEGDLETTASNIKESNNSQKKVSEIPSFLNSLQKQSNFIQSYSHCIDANELTMLKEYAKELDGNWNNVEESSLFGGTCFLHFVNDTLRDDSERYSNSDGKF